MRLKTNAQIAEENINEMMLGQLPSNWKYLDNHLEIILLETTIKELGLYLSVKNYLRPGFSSTETKVTVPTLFAKINYICEDHSDIIHSNSQTTILYNDLTVNKFHNDNKTSSYSEFKSQISSIKVFYQKLLINKIEELAQDFSQYFNDEMISLEKLFGIISGINMDVFHLYNKCDLQFNSPRLIFNLNHSLLGYEEAISLVFLNMIGFDIIVINGMVKVDLENYISSDYLNIYHGQSHIIKNPKVQLNKKKVFVAAGLVAISLLIGGIYVNSSDAKNTSSESVEVQTNTVVSAEIPERLIVESTIANNVMKENSVEVMPISSILNENHPEMFYRFKPNEVNEATQLMTVTSTFGEPYTIFERLRRFDHGDFNQNALTPNIYIYSNEIEIGENLVIVTRKFAVDGTQSNMDITLGTNYVVDLYQREVINGYVSAKVVDDYKNNVFFSQLKDGDYYRSPIYLTVTNKDTNEVTEISIGIYGSEMLLEDGRYRIDLTDVAPQNQYNTTLFTNDYVVRDKKLYYDRAINSDVKALTDELTFYCNVGDMFVINLSEIFSDEDGDHLIYDQSHEYDYYDLPGGTNEYLYFNQMTNDKEMVFEISATDMYGETATVFIIIIAVDEEF